ADDRAAAEAFRLGARRRRLDPLHEAAGVAGEHGPGGRHRESNLAIHVPTPRLALFTKDIAMNGFLRGTLVLLTVILGGCGYNALQTQDEQVKAAWSEVLNQYQRRADLVPNLVATVKGIAQQEQQVLLGVTNARAKVGSIQATPELVNDPQAFQRFT